MQADSAGRFVDLGSGLIFVAIADSVGRGELRDFDIAKRPLAVTLSPRYDFDEPTSGLLPADPAVDHIRWTSTAVCPQLVHCGYAELALNCQLRAVLPMPPL